MLAWLDRASWGSPGRTTPFSQPPSGFVTITHPHHPLRGQQVEIVCLRRGTAPQLVVRLPDGRHAALALSDTDYLASPEDERPSRPDHLLDLHGLRQVLQVLDRLAREPRPTTHDHPATAATDDPR